MNRLSITKTLSVITLAVFVIDLLFNGAAVFPGPLVDLFFNGETMSESANFVASLLTPDYWIFWIWYLIYMYQLAWIIFSLIFAFSKKTCIMPLGSYIAFLFATVFNMVWLVTYSFHQIVTSFIVIFMLFLSIGFASYWGAIFTGKTKHEELSRRTKLILHVIFENGLFLYFAWILFAQHFMLDNVLVVSGVPQRTSAAIVLALLLFFQILNIIVDTFILKRTMYTVLVLYPVIIFGLLAIITYNGSAFFALAGEVVGMVVVNLIVAVILFGVKIVLAIRRRHYGYSESSITRTCRSKA